MKEKILAQLVTKYPGVSKKFLGLWADKLAAKVTEEEKIEGALGELENMTITIPELATEWQKEADTRVTEAEKKWKLKNTPKPPKTEESDETPPPADDAPAWAKTLIEQTNTLKTELDNLKGEKQQQTIQQKIKEGLKGVPESFIKRMVLPTKEEEIEPFVTEVNQEWVNAGLGSLTAPANGSGTRGTPQASDSEIKAIVKQLF